MPKNALLRSRSLIPANQKITILRKKNTVCLQSGNIQQYQHQQQYQQRQQQQQQQKKQIFSRKGHRQSFNSVLSYHRQLERSNFHYGYRQSIRDMNNRRNSLLDHLVIRSQHYHQTKISFGNYTHKNDESFNSSHLSFPDNDHNTNSKININSSTNGTNDNKNRNTNNSNSRIKFNNDSKNSNNIDYKNIRNSNTKPTNYGNNQNQLREIENFSGDVFSNNGDSNDNYNSNIKLTNYGQSQSNFGENEDSLNDVFNPAKFHDTSGNTFSNSNNGVEFFEEDIMKRPAGGSSNVHSIRSPFQRISGYFKQVTSIFNDDHPGLYTYTGIVSFYCKNGDLEKARSTHLYMLKSDIPITPTMNEIILQAHFKKQDLYHHKLAVEILKNIQQYRGIGSFARVMKMLVTKMINDREETSAGMICPSNESQISGIEKQHFAFYSMVAAFEKCNLMTDCIVANDIEFFELLVFYAVSIGDVSFATHLIGTFYSRELKICRALGLAKEKSNQGKQRRSSSLDFESDVSIDKVKSLQMRLNNQKHKKDVIQLHYALFLGIERQMSLILSSTSSSSFDLCLENFVHNLETIKYDVMDILGRERIRHNCGSGIEENIRTLLGSLFSTIFRTSYRRLLTLDIDEINTYLSGNPLSILESYSHHLNYNNNDDNETNSGNHSNNHGYKLVHQKFILILREYLDIFEKGFYEKNHHQIPKQEIELYELVLSLQVYIGTRRDFRFAKKIFNNILNSASARATASSSWSSAATNTAFPLSLSSSPSSEVYSTFSYEVINIFAYVLCYHTVHEQSLMNDDAQRDSKSGLSFNQLHKDDKEWLYSTCFNFQHHLQKREDLLNSITNQNESNYNIDIQKNKNFQYDLMTLKKSNTHINALFSGLLLMSEDGKLSEPTS